MLIEAASERSNRPPKPRRGLQASLVTNPFNRMPEKGNEQGWFEFALDHIKRGYVHSVHEDGFVAVCWQEHGHLVMRITSRRTGSSLVISTEEPPTMDLMWRLLRRSPFLVV